MLRLLAVCGIAVAVIGCGAGPVGDELRDRGDVGTVQVALTVPGSDGSSYVLEDANFTITGPVNKSLGGSSATVSTELRNGDYAIALDSGWKLTLNGQPIRAELVSPNPQSFSIERAQTTAVAFKFKPKVGALDVIADYSLTGGYVRGTFTPAGDVAYTGTDPNLAPTHEFDGLLNHTISFAFTWESATRSTNLFNGDYSTWVEVGFPVAQFGGDEAVLTNVFTKNHPSPSPTVLTFTKFAATPTQVQWRYFEESRYAFGPMTTPAPGDSIYHLRIRPVDVVAYGATIGADGYPVGMDPLLAVPVTVEVQREAQTTDGKYPTDTITGTGIVELVPSIAF